MRKYLFLRWTLLFAATFLLTGKAVLSQHFYRIESDISIKTRVQGGQGSLTLGRVYYDKTIEKLVYDIRFPEREIWVLRDSLSLIYRNDNLHNSETVNPFTATTIFHKCLEGSLSDFGLRNTLYRIEKVEKEDNMVITTWIPPSRSPGMGQVITSTVDNNLYGVIIKNPAGDILSRQLFANYRTVGGLKVPSEITQVIYRNEDEVYQVITLDNIIINNFGNENLYNYSPGGD